MTRWGAGARYVICLVQMLAPSARPHPVLARHLPPRRGRLPSAVRIFSVLLLNPTAVLPSNRRCIKQLRTAAVAFPFEGEGGAPAPDEGGRTALFYPLWKGFFGLCVALCGASQQWRSRLLAPRLGRGSLCGNVWWSRVIFSGRCRFAQDDTWGTGAWDGGLTVGVGRMRYVGALACFALIRRFAPPSPPGGRLGVGATSKKLPSDKSYLLPQKRRCL